VPSSWSRRIDPTVSDPPQGLRWILFTKVSNAATNGYSEMLVWPNVRRLTTSYHKVCIGLGFRVHLSEALVRYESPGEIRNKRAVC
jgi:hypothetical protein